MNDPWRTPVTLDGQFVRLEPLSEAHVPGLAAVGCDDRIWRLMRYGLIRTEDDMRRWVLHLLEGQAAGTDMPFAVIQIATGKLAGATRYMEIRPEQRGLGDRRHLVRPGVPAHSRQYRGQVFITLPCF